jgi:hypothetical protein
MYLLLVYVIRWVMSAEKSAPLYFSGTVSSLETKPLIAALP